MALKLLLWTAIVSAFLTGTQSKKYYVLPEYHHYFNTVDFDTIESIWGNQYLKIRPVKSFELLEVSCFRDKDSSLKEEGLYRITEKILIENVLGQNIDNGAKTVVKRKYNVFRRSGIWKFYDASAHLLKKVNYDTR